ncbi:MAG TPA: hypothetical protein DCE41_06755 [Cytophagales bacterium]|nr:hypothetical protein [Cytophagales bacterium]HAA19956.1 hypothetical protein [Cytophagales bacterium]HAP62617.1 hypothetical protein [Cytophagales bacterium]
MNQAPNIESRLVSFNGRYLDGITKETTRALANSSPDILLVQEVTASMIDTLEMTFGSYLPYRLLHAHSKYGMAAYSRYPIQLDTALCAPGINKSWHYVQVFEVCPPNIPSFRIAHLRLPSPSAIATSSRGWMTQMNYQQQLRQIYWQLLTEVLKVLPTKPTLFIGDFNTYPGSPLYHAFTSTHYDAAAGSPYFFQGTLGTDLPWIPPLLRVDWAWLPNSMYSSDFQTLTIPKSDHKAISFLLQQ